MDISSQKRGEVTTLYGNSNGVSSGQDALRLNSLLRIKQSDIVSLHAYRETKDLIDTEKLYLSASETFPLLSNAFVLLNNALEFIEDARGYLIDDDVFGSDNAILHATSVFEELFCCRSIGDNFGTIVSAIYHSFANRDHGKLFTFSQLNKIHSILRMLRSEPFLDTNRAVDAVMALEDEGLSVDPAYFGEMMSLINE